MSFNGKTDNKKKVRFHSLAQMKKCQQLVAEGKMSEADYARMEHGTPKHGKLPDRKHEKK